MKSIINDAIHLEMIKFDSVKDIIESVEEIKVFNTKEFNSSTKYTIEFVNGDKISELNYIDGDSDNRLVTFENSYIEITVDIDDVVNIVDEYGDDYYIDRKLKYNLTKTFKDSLDGVFLVEKVLNLNNTTIRGTEIVHLGSIINNDCIQEIHLTNYPFARYTVQLKSIYEGSYKIIGRLNVAKPVERSDK